MLSFCHLEVAFESCDEGDKTVEPATFSVAGNGITGG